MNARAEATAIIGRLIIDLDELTRAAIAGHANDMRYCDNAHRLVQVAKAVAVHTDWPSMPLLVKAAEQLADALDHIVLDNDDDIDRLDGLPQLIALLRNR